MILDMRFSLHFPVFNLPFACLVNERASPAFVGASHVLSWQSELRRTNEVSRFETFKLPMNRSSGSASNCTHIYLIQTDFVCASNLVYFGVSRLAPNSTRKKRKRRATHWHNNARVNRRTVWCERQQQNSEIVLRSTVSAAKRPKGLRVDGCVRCATEKTTMNTSSFTLHSTHYTYFA